MGVVLVDADSRVESLERQIKDAERERDVESWNRLSDEHKRIARQRFSWWLGKMLYMNHHAGMREVQLMCEAFLTDNERMLALSLSFSDSILAKETP